MTNVTGAWDALRERAGVECRLHDLRRTAATKMAEAGVPESTMLGLMGHKSRAMLEHYSVVPVSTHDGRQEGPMNLASLDGPGVRFAIPASPSGRDLQASLQPGPFNISSARWGKLLVRVGPNDTIKRGYA